MSQKLTQEEELEKQYRDYKGQFEQWKEKNKNSIGTDAYNSYVKQFEEWEKDVEKRRKAIKERASTEEAKRKQLEELEREAKINETKEAEAAAAYAQSQQAYIAHHQKAMEQAEFNQRAVQHAAAQHQQFVQSQQQIDNSVNADNVIREVMTVMMAGTASAVGSAINQQPPPQTSVATGPPPTLWGNTKTVYDNRDPLFNKWGLRAAPPHHKLDTNLQIAPIPYWMLIDTLKEKKMMLAPQTNQPPPIFNPTQPAPPVSFLS